MKALVVRRPKDVAVVDWEESGASSGDVVVAVSACGVSSVDRLIADGNYPAQYPAIIGQEIAGTIQTGNAPAGRAKGERVVIDPYIPDRTCAHCLRGDVNLCEHLSVVGVSRAGGMATRVVVPADQVYQFPQRLSFAEAIFAEPLSCVLHGLERMRMQPGSAVAILGAGPAGLLMLQVLREARAGAVVVAEPLAARRELAEQLGADEVYTPEMMEHESHNEAYDVVIDCSGFSDSLNTAVRLVRRGGDVLLFSVLKPGSRSAVEPFELFRKELRLVTSYGNRANLEKAISLLAEDKVKVADLLTHSVALSQLPQILLAKRPADEVKVVVTFQESAG